MAVVCLDDDCSGDNSADNICIDQTEDGKCIVFKDDAWETSFHWVDVLEEEQDNGRETFLDDWSVAGPLATLNFMASLYSGKRINLRKLYEEYNPGQERC